MEPRIWQYSMHADIINIILIWEIGIGLFHNLIKRFEIGNYLLNRSMFGSNFASNMLHFQRKETRIVSSRLTFNEWKLKWNYCRRSHKTQKTRWEFAHIYRARGTVRLSTAWQRTKNSARTTKFSDDTILEFLYEH